MDASTSVRCIFIDSQGHICDSCDPSKDTQFYLVNTMLGLSESFHLTSITFEIDQKTSILCGIDCPAQELQDVNVRDTHSVVFHCLSCG